ncbi:hypothetical protein ABPG75_004413 [Micractinium tetrahymenae]
MQQLLIAQRLRFLGTNAGPAAAAAAASSAAAAPPRLLVLHPASLSEHSLQEALRLGESYTGEAPDFVRVGSSARLRPSPATFFGRGQVQQLATRVLAASPERIFVNHALSGVQQRNLERELGRPVLDRVALIIGIFSQRARTREARLQVELASLNYAASRLVRIVDASTGRRTAFGLEGDTEVVSARERGRSGSGAGGLGGAGGQGESELQLQRRRITERRRQLLRLLEQVRKTRAVQRAARRRSGKPQVALVGYTNAGKSSLMAALAKRSGVVAEDRLFATLDPTLRRVQLPGAGRDVILSDTVGFISDLPHQLVEAFKATLEEVTEADLLLHVLDASSPQVLAQRGAVLGVLRELGLGQRELEDKVVECWNKTDLLSPGERPALRQGSGGWTEEEVAAAEEEDEGSSSWAAGEAESTRRAAGEEGGGGRAAASSREGDSRRSGIGVGLHAAAAAGLLPAAVEALVKSDPEAALYRPVAVATSACTGQGLQELLAAVERKVQPLLAGSQQASRRRQKIAGAQEERQLQGGAEALLAGAGSAA